MPDNFSNWQSGLKAPPSHTQAVTPNDGADLPTSSRLLYVGGAGNITLDTVGGETSVLISGIPAGTMLPIRAARVRATGTTATGILAMW